MPLTRTVLITVVSKSVSMSPIIRALSAPVVSVPGSARLSIPWMAPVMRKMSMLFALASFNATEGLFELTKSIMGDDPSRLLPFNSLRSASRPPSEPKKSARDPANNDERRVSEVAASGVWAESSANVPAVRNPQTRKIVSWRLMVEPLF